MAAEVARKLPRFRLGSKKVYLPQHVVTLVHKDGQPPDWATFNVPLRFNKFDLRDYLWNLYGVETTKVRSFIRRRVAPIRNAKGLWARPAPEKYMTVTLTEPFVWPEAPTDLTPWDNAVFKLREKHQAKQERVERAKAQGIILELNKMKLDREAAALNERAKKLLAGELTWNNDLELDDKWVKTLPKKGEPKRELAEAKAEGEEVVEEAIEETVEKEAPKEVVKPAQPKKRSWKPWSRKLL